MSSKLIVLITATGCVAAAGVGSYLAVRSVPPTAAATSQAAPPIQAAAASEASPSGTTPLPLAEPSKSKPATTPGSRATQAPAAPTADITSRTAVHGPAADEAPAVAASLPADNGEGAAEPLAPQTAQPAQTVAEETATLELVEVPAEAVLGIRIETPISTETSKIEDRVIGRLTRDVSVGERVVFQAGTEVHGTVTVLERGGRVRERARLGVRFTSLLIDGKVRLPIQSDTIFRDGDAKVGQTSARVGASAVIGGIIGGVLGGKRGAAIGGAAGAAGGTAVVMAGDRSEAALPAGTTLTVRLSAPLEVTVDPRQRP